VVGNRLGYQKNLVESLAKHRYLRHNPEHRASLLFRRPVVDSVALLGLVHHEQHLEHAADKLGGADLVDGDHCGLQPGGCVGLDLGHAQVVLDEDVLGVVGASEVGLLDGWGDGDENADCDEVADGVGVALPDLDLVEVGQAAG